MTELRDDASKVSYAGDTKMTLPTLASQIRFERWETGSGFKLDKRGVRWIDGRNDKAKEGNSLRRERTSEAAQMWARYTQTSSAYHKLASVKRSEQII
nr:hypothetical protein BaRGS_025562 [Batillaria attramentaria]